MLDIDRDGRTGPGPGGGSRELSYELGVPVMTNELVFEDAFRGGIHVG